jgi:hypothetical protein
MSYVFLLFLHHFSIVEESINQSSFAFVLRRFGFVVGILFVWMATRRRSALRGRRQSHRFCISRYHRLALFLLCFVLFVAISCMKIRIDSAAACRRSTTRMCCSPRNTIWLSRHVDDCMSETLLSLLLWQRRTSESVAAAATPAVSSNQIGLVRLFCSMFFSFFPTTTTTSTTTHKHARRPTSTTKPGAKADWRWVPYRAMQVPAWIVKIL